MVDSRCRRPARAEYRDRKASEPARDLLRDHRALRGIVPQDTPHGPDAYAVVGVYEYEFAFATGTLQVRRLPG
ncbi:hypothetical protein CLM73_23145 [Achromobacter spanius]|uniref:Uncharacterized protein n=1 Tax=Achromobacter spanius TaxID=217203 RepID=A0A2S0ICJ2_9BURK|nr:hypothetical protein CLM73_23145 [Achromobacter spanius]